MNKPIVKLINENGNAFMILAKVKRALIHAGMEKEANEFIVEAKKGDYDHVLQTAMDYVEIE